MDKLNKKRVHWRETDAAGVLHDEDVDIYTSADAVTFEDGETLDEKSKDYASKNKLNEHMTDTNNPHNITPEIIGAASRTDINLFKSLLMDSSTIKSEKTNISEIIEWEDENSNNENRLGYFVSIKYIDGKAIANKASSKTIVKGVIVAHPGFASNATLDKYNDDNRLLTKYNYMVTSGCVEVVDDGKCTVGSKCICGEDGKAIPSPSNDTGYDVIYRTANDKVLIIFKPGIEITDGKYVYQLGKDQKGMFLQVVQILDQS